MPGTKAITTLNAITHGLRSSAIVLPGVEDEDDWQAFQGGVVGQLQPVGALELELASRAAELLWRLRRVPRAEQLSIAARQEPTPDDKPAKYVATGFYADVFARNDRINWADRRLLPPADLARHIIRYEAHLNRQLRHTLNQLDLIQKRRRGEPTPVARIQIEDDRYDEERV